MHKRLSYAHETEVRAITMRLPKGDGGVDIDIGKETRHGIWVPTSLEQLVEEVFVSPTASDWFADLVKRVMQRYEAGKPVRRSRLADEPFW